ncbi:MAG: TIGR02444 family protein [Mycobacterium sp.]
MGGPITPHADDPGSVKQFALALYARDGVAEACLHLQNRHDLDVTLVLFAAFVGAVRRQRLTSSNLNAARARVDAWHIEVVRPLRAVRKRLKTGPPPAPNDVTALLRGRIQKIEIEAEMIELDELGELISDWESVSTSGNAAESAAAAIETVLREHSHIPIDDLDRRAIETISSAAG